MTRFNNLLLFVSVWCGLLAIALSTPAQTWTQTSAPSTNWVSVASSADGTKLVAANYTLFTPGAISATPIYVSTNSGATWLQAAVFDDAYFFDPFDFYWVASSADGTKFIAASSNGPFYITTNWETIWTFTGPFSEGDYAGWQGLCYSADGNKLAVVAALTWIYTSPDSGTTWTAPAAPAGYGYATCVASSADGTKLIAGTFYYDALYISTNSGTDWQPVYATNEILWGAVASSADGCKLVAAVYASNLQYSNGTWIYIVGPIYTSADSGKTWTLTSAPYMNWKSIASSADGTKLVAAPEIGQIYTSTASGATLNVANVPNTNWSSVACSADGSKLFAVAKGGGIWTSQTIPTPSMNITPTNGDLKLSWIVPSANFVLQQSLDLQNWADMPHQPVLNLTNLQDEAILSPQVKSVFYRLKTP